MTYMPNKILKSGEALTLKPMSYHIMFMGFKKPLNKVDIVFKFRNAGDISTQIKLNR